MTDETRVLRSQREKGSAIQAASSLGTYLADVVGSIPKELVGLDAGGDWLRRQRSRNLRRLRAKTVDQLQQIARDQLTEPSPSVLIPLLQAAVDESREELQNLWATLLTQSMIDCGRRVRREFFAVVRQLEPDDVEILQLIYEATRNFSAKDSDGIGQIDVGLKCKLYDELGRRAKQKGLAKIMCSFQPDTSISWVVSPSRRMEFGRPCSGSVCSEYASFPWRLSQSSTQHEA